VLGDHLDVFVAVTRGRHSARCRRRDRNNGTPIDPGVAEDFL
jgi:hypothetical protein